MKIKTIEQPFLYAWPHIAFKLKLALYTSATLEDSKVPNPCQASLLAVSSA